VLKFLEERPHLYFFVNPRKPPRLLLEEYGEALRRAAGLPGHVRFASWNEFFDVLLSLRGYAVAFDEFQWFAEVAPEVPCILQRFWDTRAEKSFLTSSPPWGSPLGGSLASLPGVQRPLGPGSWSYPGQHRGSSAPNRCLAIGTHVLKSFLPIPDLQGETFA